MYLGRSRNRRSPNWIGAIMTPAELRDLRKRCGWSQQELADALGLTSRTSVSRMESGSRPIRGAVLILARQLAREWTPENKE